MIDPTARISSKARLGADVTVGPFTTIHANVEIGDGSTVGAYCELGVASPLSNGTPLSIGPDSIIRSYSLFYEGSRFGPRLMTGHRVTVRELTAGGENLQIGTLSDIQGHCSIGDYVRLHSNVHVGQASRIGSFVWIFPYVVLTNDPHPPSDLVEGCTIQDYAAIATMSVVLPGVTIGRGALVGAHSNVNRDVACDMIVGGSPARPLGRTDQIMLKADSSRHAYPWRRHFHRGYPDEVIARWRVEFPDG